MPDKQLYQNTEIGTSEGISDLMEIFKKQREQRFSPGNENQGRDWRAYYKHKEEVMKKMVIAEAENFQQDPLKIAEVLKFSSQFYQYSYRNTILIHRQNPNATFVQSFDKWKEAGAFIRRGQRGINILVPVRATLIKDGDSWVSLRDASMEQKEAYQTGGIEAKEVTRYRIGTVFDISQTTYPPEKYPEFYHMGYTDSRKGTIAQGLKNYCEKELRCPVYDSDLQSISLRGTFDRVYNRIQLNERLEDTERLSTLSHEMGHALLHKDHKKAGTKSTAQKEFEADALSLMISYHFGIEVTEKRKEHLSSHYRALEKEIDAGRGRTAAGDEAKGQEIHTSLSDVFSVYRSEIEKMDRHVQQALEHNTGYEKKMPNAMKDAMRRSASRYRYPTRTAQTGRTR